MVITGEPFSHEHVRGQCAIYAAYYFPSGVNQQVELEGGSTGRERRRRVVSGGWEGDKHMSIKLTGREDGRTSLPVCARGVAPIYE